MRRRLLGVVFALTGLLIGPAASAIEFDESKYEVYYGDFDADGNEGDIYFHHKDIFVLIHGDVAVPIYAASDDSYIVYSGSSEASVLKLTSSDLEGYTQGVLGDDYHFTDSNNDGLQDIVAINPDSNNGSTELLASSGETPVVNQIPSSLVEGSPVSQPPPLSGNLLATVTDPVNDILDGSEYRGSLEGSFSVGNDASFNYSIPIATPPGVNGIEPDVSLNYSSSERNGLLGWGWEVSGLSKIHRCPKDTVRDNQNGGYLYCLDGERLIGVAYRVYRTESESFLHITNRDGYWTAIDRNGTEWRYGFNDDAEDGPIGQTRAWHLDRVQDVFGNTLTVSYQKGTLTAGHYHRPATISYTSNSADTDIPLRVVRFAYEDRPDLVGKVWSSTQYINTKRLASIQVESEGEILWSYDLSYQQDGLTYHGKLYEDPVGISRLAAVERCFYANGVKDFCQEPVEFDWTERNSGSHIYTTMDWRTRTRRSTLQSQGTTTLEAKVYFDIDNDGVEDAYYAAFDSATATYNGAEEYIPESEWLAVDVNADGYKDIVKVNAIISGVEVFLNEKNPSPEEGEPDRRIASSASTGYSVAASQVSFDAVRKYMYMVSVGMHGGINEFSTRTGKFGYELKFVDINADGLIDLVRVPPGCGEPRHLCTFLDPSDDPSADTLDYDNQVGYRKDISVVYNTGTGWMKSGGQVAFNSWYSSWDNTQQENSVEFVDLNGDSLPDLLGLHAQYGSVNVRPMYLLHNGEQALSAGAFVSSTALGSMEDFGRNTTGDYNGDGRIDFATIPVGSYNGQNPIEHEIKIRLGTDAQTLPEHIALDDANFSPYCDNNRPHGSFCIRTAVDFNKDGYDDIVESSGCADVVRSGDYGYVNVNGTLVWQELEPSRPGEVAAYEECIDFGTASLPSFTSQVWLSKGPSSSGGVHFAAPIIYRTSSAVHPSKLRFEDFNNDGILEDAHWQTSSLKEHRIERVISAVTSVAIEYESFAATANPISAGGVSGDRMLEVMVYQDDSDRVKVEQLRLLPKRFGVGTLEVSNGLGSSNRVEYSYKDALVHGGGWGDLGFGTIEKRSYTAGSAEYMRTVSEYNQVANNQYKLARKLKRERVYAVDEQGNEQILSDSRYRWKVRLYGDDTDPSYQSPHYMAYLYESSARTWDLDGSAIATTRVKNHSVSTRSCSELSLTDIDTVLTTTADDDYHADGILKYSEAITCDQSGTDADVQLKAEEKNNVISLGDRRGLVQESKVHVWAGSSVAAIDVADFETRTKAYSYFESGTAIGSLQTETREPGGGAGVRLQTAYTYNSYGSVASVTESWTNGTHDGLDFTSRVKIFNESYDSLGRRTVTVTHPLLGSETSIYHPVWGKIVKHTDVNGLVTDTLYDDLGRSEQVTAPGNIVTLMDYRTCDNCFSHNDRAVKYTQTKTTGSGAQRQYLDIFGRTVGTRTRGFDGAFVYTAQFYNAKGQVTDSWAPFYPDAAVQTTSFDYDQLGRVVRTDYPDASYKTHTYSGLETETTNAEGQIQQRLSNAAGWVMRSTDNANTPVDFTYNGFGQLTGTIVNNDEDTQTAIDYDVLGRKVLLSDPNTGTIHYDYNALDLMASQTDAKGQVTRYTFDRAGRQVTRTDNATGTARTQQWHYDTQFKGLADSLSGYTTEGEVYGETYTYNTLGMPKTVTANYAGRSLSVTHGYDNHYRSLSTTYPGGYQVVNIYNTWGYLNTVAETDSKRPLWKAYNVNALGQVTQAQLGDGSITTRDYTPETGRIDRIAVERSGVTLMDQSYVFDNIGKLTERSDAVNNVVESLCYDNMNRLTAARTNGCSSSHNDFTYNALGNITSKLHVGSYQYDETNNAGPHAVTAANGLTYHYDANGNLAEAKNASNQVVREVEYSAFNKPTYIRNDNRWTKVTYGPDQMRVKREDDNGRVTYYFGSLYEEVIDGGITQRIHTVGDFALHIEKFGLETDEYNQYLHRDHLGSIVTRSTDNESLVDQQAFSAWGQRLLLAWDGIEAGPGYEASSLRGYTGHEHLDNVGLIHMNGRVYDPELGRFLSPDPFVQAPHNTQSYNRYAYVFNNPLSLTDPTGYVTEEVIVTGHRPTSGGSSSSSFGSYSIPMSDLFDSRGAMGRQTFMNYRLETELTFLATQLRHMDGAVIRDGKGGFYKVRVDDKEREDGTSVLESGACFEGAAQDCAQEEEGFHPFVSDSAFEEYFTEMDALQTRVDQLEAGPYYKGISHDIGVLKTKMDDLTYSLSCQMDMCGINPVAPELLFVPGGGLARAGWSMKFFRYPNAGGGGLNLFKNGTRRFAVEYHKFKLDGVEKMRLHYHRGATKSQMKKHRPYQGGW